MAAVKHEVSIHIRLSDEADAKGDWQGLNSVRAEHGKRKASRSKGANPAAGCITQEQLCNK